MKCCNIILRVVHKVIDDYIMYIVATSDDGPDEFLCSSVIVHLVRQVTSVSLFRVLVILEASYLRLL